MGPRIAMLLPPWLDLPPHGYGGIELTVDALVRELERSGASVEVFATGATTTPCTALHHVYDNGQYRHIARPLHESLPCAAEQVVFSLQAVADDGGFDVVHDHNTFLGPLAMAFADADRLPPMLHTLHAPFTTDRDVAAGVPDNRPLYRRLAQTGGRTWFAGISRAQLASAPQGFARRVAGVAYNALDVEQFPFSASHDGYCVTMARICPDKGQATAARVCRRLGMPLRMAGIVVDIDDPQVLAGHLADPDSPYRRHPEFSYFERELAPLLEPGLVEYVGSVGGTAKDRLLARARALLFPIDWDEPFGMAVVEALACGTPVVAMRRGAMPELIEHGVTGFLARDEDEFAEYVGRVDELDPARCRASVAERFTSEVVARRYLGMYEQVIADDARARIGPPAADDRRERPAARLMSAPGT